MTNTNDFKVSGTTQVGKQVTTKLGSYTSSSEDYRVAALSYATASQVSTVSLGTTPRRFGFNPTGTRLYVNDTFADLLKQYTLSTAWDVTTASIDGNLDYNPPSASVNDFAFSNTGRKVFVVNSVNAVYRYDVNPAYEIAGITTSDQNATFTPGSGGTFQYIAFNADGTRMFLKKNSTNVVSYYDLGTAYDLSSAGSENTVTITDGLSGSSEMSFANGGLIFTLYGGGGGVQLFTLATAYDLSTATLTDTSGSMPLTSLRFPVFGDSGQLMYFMDTTGDDIYAYPANVTTYNADLSTGNYFEITTDDYKEVRFTNVPATGSQVFTVKARGDTGFGMNLSGTQTLDLDEFTLLNAFSGNDVSNWSNIGSAYMTRNGRYILSASVFGAGNAFLWKLHTPYDVTTASVISTIQGNSIVDNAVNVFLREDGRKAYIGTSTSLKELDLDPPFALTTTATNTINPGGARNLFFKPDGTRYFCTNITSTTAVDTFDLSTPWDISTALDASITLATAATTAIGGLSLSDDGKFLFACSAGVDDKIWCYSLGTAWDVSSATFLGFLSILTPSTNVPVAIFVHPSMNRVIYFDDTASNTVNAVTISATFFNPVFKDNILWTDGAAPTYDATSNVKMITFVTNDGGTSYIAGYEDVHV